MSFSQVHPLPKSITDAINEESSSLDRTYFDSLSEDYSKAKFAATEAKKEGVDLDSSPQSQEVCDMADRLELITGIKGFAESLRKMDSSLSATQLALKSAEDIALGRFGFLNKEQIMNLALQASLSVVTSSVSMIPYSDITSVVIKKNGDGTSYPAVLFGQIGSTLTPIEGAFLLLIADRIRVMIGLEKYHVNSVGDDEVSRFIEEIGIYQREHDAATFRITEEDLRLVLQNIPVEIDGRGTEDSEVVVHRNLQRIKDNRVRGGALQILIEGIVGKHSRVLELAQALQVPEWDWLAKIKSNPMSKEPKGEVAYILNAKPGKPVLSLPDAPGSFRLRYGRAENTGSGSFGFHPAVFELLDSPLSTGTRIKISIANRIGTAGVVDSLRPPMVRLQDGEVRNINNLLEAEQCKNHLDKIIDLGDVLASPSEFLHSNQPLEASGYVEEWWISDVRKAMEDRHLNLQQLSTSTSLDLDRLTLLLENSLTVKPTLSEALKFSDILEVPLHPSYSFFWDLLTIKDIFFLREAIVDFQENPPEPAALSITNSVDAKRCLELAHIPHKVQGPLLKLYGEDAKATYLTLTPDKPIPLGTSYSDTLNLLRFLSGVEIRRKSSQYIGVAMRKVEISNERKMRPPVHVLFPVGTKGIQSRDVLQSHHIPSVTELNIRSCRSCGASSPYGSCPFCEAKTLQLYYCPSCKRERMNEQCPDCKADTLPYTNVVPHTQDLLRAASDTVGLQPYPPLKGVSQLGNRSRTPERLEKGILRQRHNLTCFKDGTVRYDVVNAPLTHFKPLQFHLDLKTMQELGYVTDKFGKPLESEDQIVELKPQDIILPQDSGDHLKRLSNYLDDVLTRFFKVKAFYDAQSQRDLVGALAVGISPEASLGIVGRIIGFTDARVCYAHPFWHAAKYRDCGGDVDSITLLMDVLLNFSPSLCPDHVTGLLDTPVMIEPVVLPSFSHRKPSFFDRLDSYPLEFFLRTSERPSVHSLEGILQATSEANRVGRNYLYTHWSTSTVTSQPRSSYSIPGPMPDKVSRQIATATKIQTVDVDGLISSLLNNYLVKEIIITLDAYSTQEFRCRGCGEVYRRPPLKGTCLTCGKELIPSVSLSTVEKYVLLANELINTHHIAQPTKDKVTLALENLRLLSEYKKQTSIVDFT